MSNTNADFYQSIRELFSNPDIKRVGEDLLRDIQKDLDEACPPKMLFCGKTGVGKSSLINAVFGQEIVKVDILPCTFGTPQQDLTINTEQGVRKIVIHDTQGLDDITKDNPETIRILNQLILECDLTIYVFDGSTRAWDSDKHILSKLRIEKRPILVLVNRLDALEPTREWNPPYTLHDGGLEEKGQNIREKMIWADTQIKTCISQPANFEIIPIAVPNDKHWNVELLIERIETFLPDHTKLSFIRQLPYSPAKIRICEKISRLWISKYVALAATIGAAPIPMADIIPLTTLQGTMWSHIAYIYGKSNILESVTAFFGAGGIGFIFKLLVQELVKLLPTGSFVTAAVASAVTKGYGEAAIEYYNRDGAVSPKELQKLVEKFIGDFVSEVLNTTFRS